MAAVTEYAAAQRDRRARMADTPNQRARSTRAALVAAYQALLAEHSTRVSVSAVVERANVNRTTFYAHFSSLTALAAEARGQAAPRRSTGEWRSLSPGGSRARLRAAVLDAAAHARIEDVTVAQVVRRAGVTRATFYKHAVSPVALLAELLGEEIGLLADGVLAEARRRSLDLHSAYELAARAVMTHVIAHEAVYRMGLGAEPSSAGLLHMLCDQFTRLLRGILRADGAGGPAIDRILPGSSEAVLDMCLAHAAYGGVGLLAQWLRSTDRNPGFLPDVAVNALPEFWSRMGAPATGHDQGFAG